MRAFETPVPQPCLGIIKETTLQEATHSFSCRFERGTNEMLGIVFGVQGFNDVGDGLYSFGAKCDDGNVITSSKSCSKHKVYST